MGFLPENQVRTRLPAGGRRIRTAGPPLKTGGFSEQASSPPPAGKPSRNRGIRLERDRWFESVFLHRRVRCEQSKTAYRSYAGGATNFGKSTSPTTELRERPMHDGTNLPVPERTGIPGGCATLFVSLELSRSTWVATSLAPGSKK